MIKQVQISEQLFSMICGYFLLDKKDTEPMICEMLENKLDRLMKHNEYSLRMATKRDSLD